MIQEFILDDAADMLQLSRLRTRFEFEITLTPPVRIHVQLLEEPPLRAGTQSAVLRVHVPWHDGLPAEVNCTRRGSVVCRFDTFATRPTLLTVGCDSHEYPATWPDLVTFAVSSNGRCCWLPTAGRPTEARDVLAREEALFTDATLTFGQDPGDSRFGMLELRGTVEVSEAHLHLAASPAYHALGLLPGKSMR